MSLVHRPRRNRKSESMRSLVRENIVTPKDLIAPLFVIEGKGKREEILSMPGYARLSLDLIVEEAKALWALGIPCVSLFPALSDSVKDSKATESTNPDGLYQRTIQSLKEAIPEMLVMTDVALDPYSSDGHDGYVDPKTGEILNDESLDILAKMAVSQAKAGSDIIGPSDMMDGRTSKIRLSLDLLLQILDIDFRKLDAHDSCQRGGLHLGQLDVLGTSPLVPFLVRDELGSIRTDRRRLEALLRNGRPDGLVLVTLGHLGTIGVEDEREMGIGRTIEPERILQQHVLGRVVQVLLAPDDVADLHQRIIHHDREVVGREAIRLADDEILKLSRGHDDLAEHRILDVHRAFRHLEPHDMRATLCQQGVDHLLVQLERGPVVFVRDLRFPGRLP